MTEEQKKKERHEEAKRALGLNRSLTKFDLALWQLKKSK